MNVHWKDWYWSWSSNTLATWCKELTDLKRPWFWESWTQEEKGTTEDEMVRWHHRLNGCGFGWTLGVDDGQEDQACCGSWDRKESDTTEQLNWTLMSPVKRQSDITLILPAFFFFLTNAVWSYTLHTASSRKESSKILFLRIQFLRLLFSTSLFYPESPYQLFFFLNFKIFNSYMRSQTWTPLPSPSP